MLHGLYPRQANMMNQEEILDNLKKDVRSLLMSCKMGLEPEQLKRDYVATLGHPMPLKQLGFRDVMDMAKEMPDVVAVEFRPDGSQYLKALGHETTENIERLVAKQRMSKLDMKIKSGRHASFSPRHYQLPSSVVLPRRGRAPPPLPAHLRAQIRILLSQGPLRLVDLESSFFRFFGFPLHVHHYGFFSTGEMLVAAADMVTVQQGRLGSVLALRQHMVPRPLLAAASSTRTELKKPGWPRANSPQIKGSHAGVKPLTGSPVKGSPVIQLCPEAAVGPIHEGPPLLRSRPEVADRNQKEDKPPLSPESQLFLQRVLKLEEEFRQQIVENGIAGTISQDLKDKLRKVICQKTGGLSVHDLPAEYKRLHGEDLPLTQSGFTSVTELVAALNDLFCLKPAIGDHGHHWIISDIQDVGNKQNEEQACSDGVEFPVKSYYFSSGESAWERQSKRYEEEEDTDVTTDDEMEELQSDPKSNTNELTSEAYCVMQLHCGPTLPLDAMQNERLKPPLRHAVRTLEEIVVGMVESPGHFYIRFTRSDGARALEIMMFEMRRCYKSPNVSERYRLPEQFVRRGQVCCASPRGMWFYRLVIHQILSPTEVQVYYVDFGEVSVMETTNLKFLKSCYSVLPAQAVPSSLAGITPNRGSWTAEATACFQAMCFERTLVGALDHYTGKVLHLYLCDTSTAEDVYFHSVLLSQRHGKACSLAATSAVTPVSLYLGNGMVDLPEVDLDKSFSSKSVDQSMVSTLEDEEDEMPALELIEGIEVDEGNPFGALLSGRSLDGSEPSALTRDSPPVSPTTPSRSRLAPPDLILTQSP